MNDSFDVTIFATPSFMVKARRRLELPIERNVLGYLNEYVKGVLFFPDQYPKHSGDQVGVSPDTGLGFLIRPPAEAFRIGPVDYVAVDCISGSSISRYTDNLTKAEALNVRWI